MDLAAVVVAAAAVATAVTAAIAAAAEQDQKQDDPDQAAAAAAHTIVAITVHREYLLKFFEGLVDRSFHGILLRPEVCIPHPA